MNQNACASTREPRSAPTLNSQTRWSYQIYQMVSRRKDKANFFLKAGISKIGGLSLLWFNVIATFLQKYYASIVDISSRQLLSFI